MFAVLPNALQAADTDADAIQAVVDLLGDEDKEMRSLGLQQVREECKGEAATKKFAALLPKLQPGVQAELLAALADRGDKAARSAAHDSLKSTDAAVRLAAIRAIGALGEPADVALLMQQLGSSSAEERAAARKSLLRMCGPNFNPAIVAELQKTDAKLQVELLAILAERRATDSVPAVLVFVDNENPDIRKAAMTALGALAGQEHVARMLTGVLKAAPGSEREAAERAVVMVCNRVKDPEKRADSVLVVWASFNDKDKTVLLATLGRLGGVKALKIVEAAIADPDVQRQAAAFGAICNWPNASVIPQLLEMAKNGKSEAQKRQALRALTRVAVVADKRTPAERLALLGTAISLATTAEERNYVLKRAAAKPVRTIETLRFVLPYADQPECAQEACATIVELAHHRDLREPNKAEFMKALDKVLAVAKDADVRERAERYKRGQTRLLKAK
jgi:HEAT repeat protein